MDVYKPKIVLDLEEFYGDLLVAYDQYPNVVEHLSALSEKLYEGVQQKVRVLFSELNNYNTSFIGKSVDELLTMTISKQDCYETIAMEHGFATWQILSQHSDLVYNPNFERAINVFLAGDSVELFTILKQHTHLIHERSPYGHHAQILHYAASNGVEFWRQKVPYNLADLCKLLLESGADRAATMSVYGGQFTTLELLTTSAHPYEADVVNEVTEVLKT